MNFNRARLWTVIALLFSAGTASPLWAADTLRATAGRFLISQHFVAQDKGYYEKLGLQVEGKSFDDGSLAIPAMLAGELDVVAVPAAANLFNSIAKGAPIVVFMERSRNAHGQDITALTVSNAMYDSGLRSLADLALIKGKRVGVGALGSTNQYNFAQGLTKLGLNPATDVQWMTNAAQPDLLKMLGVGLLDAVETASQFAKRAEDDGIGRIIARGGDEAPDVPVVLYAVRTDFLKTKKDALVRFAMANMQAAKDYNTAARAPDQHPEILEILARNTIFQKPDVIKALAPYWGYASEDGMPDVKGTMAMQDFWAGEGFAFVQKKVAGDQLFDLSVAREAKERLDKEKPFGK